MKSGDILKKAFIDADKERLSQLPEDDEIDWTPSRQFESKMGKLIKKQNSPARKLFNTIGKRTAAAAIIAAVLICSALSVSAIRKPVFEYIVSVYEKFTSFIPGNTADTPEVIEKYYTLPFIPDGFSPVSEKYGDYVRMITYENDTAETLVFIQSVIGNTEFNVNTEGAELIQTEVSGDKGYYYISKGCITLIWSDGEYSFMISAPDNFPPEDMINLAEGIKN